MFAKYCLFSFKISVPASKHHIANNLKRHIM